MNTGGSLSVGGRMKKKKRKGGLFRPTSKRRSKAFATDTFEAGAVMAGAGPLAPIGVAMMGGAAIGTGIVEALDAIF